MRKIVSIDTGRLPALIDLAQGLIDALPRYDYDRPEPYRRRVQTLEAALGAKGAMFRQTGDGKQMKLAGVRASSTSGTTGMIRNWIGAARRKVEEAGR